MSKKKKKAKRAWGFLKFQIVLIALALIAIAYYYVGGYAAKVASLRKEAVSLVASSSKDTFRSQQTSVVYDAHGEVISYLKGEKDVYYLTLDEIPLYAQQAVISVEDKKFFSHHGVDYKAIIRAVYAMFRNGKITQGASTITQQLARGVFLTNDKTWERKIEELYVAVELEKKYTKAEILEFYLNNVYFKNGYYGLEAASQGYFSKSAKELTLSEICFLCAIPNNPNRYNPLEHFDRTLGRRDIILNSMLEDRLISEASYYDAISQTIVLNLSDDIKHDYAETYTYYCATRVLMELNGFQFKSDFTSDEEEAAYNEEYEQEYNDCNARLFTGGYRIYTSLDLAMQQKLQAAIDGGLAKFEDVSENGIYELQGAAVCIDNGSGMVRAIVGGRSQDIKGYTLNRAYQSFRQPGSSIKPLIVYTPALEREYTADSIVRDEPIEDGPSNADGTYLGDITLRRAVELSRNTVAWNLFNEITPEVGLSYLKAMDFAKIDANDYRNAVALGGFTNGVSPLEMAKAYATLENSGGYRNPSCILKITDALGNEIYKTDQTEMEVYKSNAARAMTDILEGVMTDGTARRLKLSNMACAGKTGTTNDNKDGWFVGYTPYYTTSVWVGYDTPKKLPGLTGASYPGSIWQVFMTDIHKGLSRKEFLDQAAVSDEENMGEDTMAEQETIVEQEQQNHAGENQNTAPPAAAPSEEGTATEEEDEFAGWTEGDDTEEDEEYEEDIDTTEGPEDDPIWFNENTL